MASLKRLEIDDEMGRGCSSMVEHLVANQKATGSSPVTRSYRGIAQSGSASALGAEGRRFKSCCPDHFFHGAIAQLGEHLTGSQKVGGSIPPGSTFNMRST